MALRAQDFSEEITADVVERERILEVEPEDVTELQFTIKF